MPAVVVPPLATLKLLFEIEAFEKCVGNLRAVFGDRKDPFTFLGFGEPMDPVTGSCVPPLRDAINLSARMATLEANFLSTTLLFKFQRAEDDAWYRGLAKRFRLLRAMFLCLQQDVLQHHWLLFTAVLSDIQEHSLVDAHGTHLAIAADRARAAMPEQDPDRQFRLEQARVDAYKAIHPMRRIVPDANSLSEWKLRRRLARLFEMTLQRWDRCHGLDIPSVHGTLTALAYRDCTCVY
jgi:hypothetical protein